MRSLPVKAYKAFNPDMTCRDFQYEVGETYVHAGAVEPCISGFHACEHPLDVLAYYPDTSRFAEVSLNGTIRRGYSNFAAGEITIVREISFRELVKKVHPPQHTINSFEDAYTTEQREHATTLGYEAHARTTESYSDAITEGPRADASTRGHHANAVTFNYSSHATTYGDQAQAVSFGTGSKSTTLGYGSEATVMGIQSIACTEGPEADAFAGGADSRATVSGKGSTAVAYGASAKVRGELGCFITIFEIGHRGNILHKFTSAVGENNVEPNVWYTLKGGKLISSEH